MPFDTAPQKQITDEVSLVIARAIDIIEREGWCQDGFKDAQGRHCVAGALWKAATGKEPMGTQTTSDEDCPVYTRAFTRLCGLLGRHVPCWNDMPGRTKDEVIELMKEGVY